MTDSDPDLDVSMSSQTSDRRSTRSTRGTHNGRYSPTGSDNSQRQPRSSRRVRIAERRATSLNPGTPTSPGRHQNPDRTPSPLDMDFHNEEVEKFFVATCSLCVLVESYEELSERDQQLELLQGAQVELKIYGLSDVLFVGFVDEEEAREAAEQHSRAHNIPFGRKRRNYIIYETTANPAVYQELRETIESLSREVLTLRRQIERMETDYRERCNDLHIRFDNVLTNFGDNNVLATANVSTNVNPGTDVGVAPTVPVEVPVNPQIFDAPHWTYIPEDECRLLFRTNVADYDEIIFGRHFTECECFLNKLPRQKYTEYQNIIKFLENALDDGRVRQIEYRLEEMRKRLAKNLRNKLNRCGEDGGAMIQGKKAIPVRYQDGLYGPATNVRFSRQNLETASQRYFVLLSDSGERMSTMFAIKEGGSAIRSHYLYFVISAQGEFIAQAS